MQARAQEVASLDKTFDLLSEVVSTDPNLGKAPAYVPPPSMTRRSRPARACGNRAANKPHSGSRPAPATNRLPTAAATTGAPPQADARHAPAESNRSGARAPHAQPDLQKLTSGPSAIRA